MKLIRKNNKKGFTLVELIVVIAIIAILALILIPAITGYTERANKSAVESSARALYSQSVLLITDSESENGITALELKTELEKVADSKYTVTVDSPADGVKIKAGDDYKVTVSKGDNGPEASFNQDGLTTP